MLFQKDVVISPENLRYLARQLRGLLALRKHLHVERVMDDEGTDLFDLPLLDIKDVLIESIEARNKLHKEKYGEELIDTSSIPGYPGGDFNPKPSLTDLQDALLN